MAEVRSTTNRGLALYTQKSYQPGDIIIEESPLFIFKPKSAEQIAKIRFEFRGLSSPLPPTDDDDDDDENDNDNNNDKKSRKQTAKKQKQKLKQKQSIAALQLCCLFDISLPSTIESNQSAKFRQMIIAAACYALFCKDGDDDNTDEIKTADDDDGTLSSSQKIQKLYYPVTDDTTPTPPNNNNNNNNEKDDAIQIANQALNFLQTRTKPSETLHTFATQHPTECHTIMLIWACNTFKGGFLYETMSRVNHSCDFNCVVTTTDGDNENNKNSNNNQIDNGATKQVLRAACTIEPNEELTISYLGSFTYACRATRRRRLRADKLFTCHCVRCVVGGEEGGDVAASVPCRTCHPRSGRYLEEEAQYDDDDDFVVKYAVPHWRQGEDAVEGGGGVERPKWVCTACKEKTMDVIPADSTNDELSTAMERTLERVELHLLREKIDSDNENVKEMTNEEDREMVEKLSCLSSSVMGSRHWCTNLVLISLLGTKLTSMHTAMLFDGTTGSGVGNKVDLEDLAECIDSLQRLWNFVTRLGLRSHPGHLLGSLTVGVARVLVGLGDEKSMKYGAEWAEKVDVDYYRKGFEGEGMIKVLDVMTKRKVRGGEEDNAQKKKRIKR